MSRLEKLLTRAKDSPNNFSFADLCTLLRQAGYEHVRSKGSHRFFRHPSTGDIVNIQPKQGKAKPSQVRDVVSKIEDLILPES